VGEAREGEAGSPAPLPLKLYRCAYIGDDGVGGLD
jgi:hypothetical protein